jgi:cytochrome P450
MPKGMVPLLGHLLRVSKIHKKYNLPTYPSVTMFEQDFPEGMPDVVMAFYGFEPTLWIQGTEILNDLYVTKNKYFDKHPLIQNLVEPLLGDSLLLEQSNDLWSQKRKHISAAFYKEKLISYLEVIKRIVDT